MVWVNPDMTKIIQELISLLEEQEKVKIDYELEETAWGGRKERQAWNMIVETVKNGTGATGLTGPEMTGALILNRKQ